MSGWYGWFLDQGGDVLFVVTLAWLAITLIGRILDRRGSGGGS